MSAAGVYPALWGSSSPLAAWAQIGSTQSCLSALGTPWPFPLLAAGTTTKVTKSRAFPSSFQPHSITNRKESEGPLLPSPPLLLVWSICYTPPGFLISPPRPPLGSVPSLSRKLYSHQHCSLPQIVNCSEGSAMLPYLEANPVSWQETRSFWVTDREQRCSWHSRKHALPRGQLRGRPGWLLCPQCVCVSAEEPRV